MKELFDIVRAYDGLVESGHPSALATVVGVTGSTYRRPGARMLFSQDGRRAGLINAACLESDLSERARKVIHSGKPELVSYDTTSPDDIVFGLGLGCNGTVEILMEPGQCTATVKKIAVLKEILTGNVPLVLATVVAAEGVQGIRVGDFVASSSQKMLDGTMTDGPLRATMESDCRSMRDVLFCQKSYKAGTTEVRVSFEILHPPQPLVIVGAGPDAIPLVESAKSLGWNVTVVDHRPAFATKETVPGADAVVLSEPERMSEQVKVSRRTVAVIMTHNFDKDRKLLKMLLPSEARYVGLLGPKSKLQTLLQNLEKEGFKPTKEQLAKLHAPIGLDIGAETPEEIAFSIISEIKAVLEGRSGGFLKERNGPIH